MSCGKDAVKIVVIGGPGQLKDDSEAATKIAAERKCGESCGRFGFVCSKDCAVARGWLW